MNHLDAVNHSVICLCLQRRLLEEEQKDRIITKLHCILRPFLLRRVKHDVKLSLPDKEEKVVSILHSFCHVPTLRHRSARVHPFDQPSTEVLHRRNQKGDSVAPKTRERAVR